MAYALLYGRDIGGVDDISLTIKAGEKVGVVGASGAGKSTLVALLLRLYDTEKGSVSIDGHRPAHGHSGKLCGAK